MPHPDQRSAGALHGRPKAPPITDDRTPAATAHGFPLDPSSGLPSFDEPDEHVATEIGVGAPTSHLEPQDDPAERATPVMPTRERIVIAIPELVWSARGALDTTLELGFDARRDAVLPDAPITVGAALTASLAL